MNDDPMAAERETAKLNAAAQPEAHEPGPVPDGPVFTVHGFRGVTRSIDDEKKAFGKLLGAVTHEQALEKCEVANKISGEDVWFGVVPNDAAVDDPLPDRPALPDPKTPSVAPSPGFGKVSGS